VRFTEINLLGVYVAPMSLTKGVYASYGIRDSLRLHHAPSRGARGHCGL
jgi:hypothetical protein